MAAVYGVVIVNEPADTVTVTFWVSVQLEPGTGVPGHADWVTVNGSGPPVEPLYAEFVGVNTAVMLYGVPLGASATLASTSLYSPAVPSLVDTMPSEEPFASKFTEPARPAVTGESASVMFAVKVTDPNCGVVFGLTDNAVEVVICGAPMWYVNTDDVEP